MDARCCVIVCVAFLAAFFPLADAQSAAECRQCLTDCRDDTNAEAAIECMAMLVNSSCPDVEVFTSDPCTIWTTCREDCDRPNNAACCPVERDDCHEELGLMMNFNRASNRFGRCMRRFCRRLTPTRAATTRTCRAETCEEECRRRLSAAALCRNCVRECTSNRNVEQEAICDERLVEESNCENADVLTDIDCTFYNTCRETCRRPASPDCCYNEKTACQDAVNAISETDEEVNLRRITTRLRSCRRRFCRSIAPSRRETTLECRMEECADDCMPSR